MEAERMLAAAEFLKAEGLMSAETAAAHIMEAQRIIAAESAVASPSSRSPRISNSVRVVKPLHGYQSPQDLHIYTQEEAEQIFEFFNVE
jgi:hypothetical protein